LAAGRWPAGQSSIRTIAAGLLVGISGGSLIVAARRPPADEGPPSAEIALLACPGSGPVLADIPAGTSLLVTARSTDGQWLEAYLGEPGADYAWAPAADVQLASAADTLPASACTATTAQRSAPPTGDGRCARYGDARANASGYRIAGDRSDAIADGVAHARTDARTQRRADRHSNGPGPSPTSSPTLITHAYAEFQAVADTDAAEANTHAEPATQADADTNPTATPGDTTSPSLSKLNANPQCINTFAESVISVTVTDPDDPVSSVTIGSLSRGTGSHGCST
jgi:hypothetical protein